MSPRFFYRSPLNHYTLLANSSLQKRNSASDSNRLFLHGLRRILAKNHMRKVFIRQKLRHKRPKSR